MKSIKKIEAEDFSTFQKEIEKNRNLVDRTLNLAWFYLNARFKVSQSDFENIHSVDGSNDGGIDCYYHEGNTYYIIQAKYHERSQNESSNSVYHELQKIEKTIIGNNTNKKAEEFVNALKRDLENNTAYLEIIWLTTNEVQTKVRSEAQRHLDTIIGKHRWEINADINFIDRYSLEGVIYDIRHGYVPHTGKKELAIENGEYMKISKDRNNIEALVCNVKAIDILNWFKSSSEITTYLQKNVRESVGDKSPINKALRKSFNSDPGLFWYKHNGIIIFADWLETNDHDKRIFIRNPQIVNGAQTITQLFKAYDENRAINNPSKLLVRVYRLPYEDSETYRRSIDIISALNSQNKIKASDLHSTDPRQVMLENRFDELGLRFQYFRKRTDTDKKAGWNNIFMTRLGMIYHVCSHVQPDEGVRNNIEAYFEEEKKYDEAFPENQIKKPLSSKPDHIVFDYIDAWYLYFIVDRYLSQELNRKQQDLFRSLLWYPIVDVYQQQQQWKEKYFQEGWREWTTFLDSPEYTNAIIKYCKSQYAKFQKIIPAHEAEPRNFLKSTDARKKFSKISGNQFAFKKEITKSWDTYKRKRGY